MINPYEETAQEMKRQSEGPKRFAKAALGTAGAFGATAFAPLLARAAPLLSEYIPEDLAIKGLSKINPRFGKFIQDALSQGHSFSEAKKFIGDQINESKTSAPKKNIIEQESPELHQFMLDEIKKGRTPMAAGALVALPGYQRNNFKKIISKLMNAHNLSWGQIIDSVYGPSGSQQSTAEAAPQPAEMGGGAQAPQMGPGMQNLYRILEEINKSGI